MTALLALLAIAAAGRLEAATITVSETGDTIAPNSQASLREAILSINAGADLNSDVTTHRVGTYGLGDLIQFSIGGSGEQTIALGLPLPTLRVSIGIDGTTQPGFAGIPIITLDGAGAPPGTHGLVVAPPAQVQLSGLILDNFAGDGVLRTPTPPYVFADGFESGSTAAWISPPFFGQALPSARDWSIEVGDRGTAGAVAPGAGRVPNGADLNLSYLQIHFCGRYAMALEAPGDVAGSNVELSGCGLGGIRVALGNLTISSPAQIQSNGASGSPGVGIRVEPGARASFTGTPGQPIAVDTTSGIGLLSLGNVFALNVNFVNNQNGIVVATEDAPLFGLPTDPAPVRSAVFQNVTVAESIVGAIPGLDGSGVVVLRTRADGDLAATAGRFFYGLNSAVPAISASNFNNGSGFLIGGGAHPSFGVCAQLAVLELGFTCGPVDASIVDTTVNANLTGVTVQNGGAAGTATALHFVFNDVTQSGNEGVLVRPSVFLPPPAASPGANRTFNQNLIHDNADFGSTIAEVTFDGAAYAGAAVPGTPFNWSIGSSLDAQFSCGTTAHNSIFEFRCVGAEHPGLRARNAASVAAEVVTWSRVPAAGIDVIADAFSTVDFDPSCTPNAVCD